MGFWEPVEYLHKVYRSSIFLIDPRFNGDLEKCDRGFDDNDFGGFNVPRVMPHWPLTSREV
jgi:hypothetical protein